MSWLWKCEAVIILLLFCVYRGQTFPITRDIRSTQDSVFLPSPLCERHANPLHLCSSFNAARYPSVANCSCQCSKDAATFGFYNGSWKCTKNDLVRKLAGCKDLVFAHTSTTTHSGPTLQVFSKTHYVKNVTSNVLVNCLPRLEQASYQECNGQWTEFPADDTDFHFYREATRVSATFHKLAYMDDENIRNISGRILQYRYSCGGHKVCLLFKIEGTLNCPSATQLPQHISNDVGVPPTEVIIPTATTSARNTTTTSTATKVIETTSNTTFPVGDKEAESADDGVPMTAMAAGLASGLVITVCVVAALVIHYKRRQLPRDPRVKPTSVVPTDHEPNSHENTIYFRFLEVPTRSSAKYEVPEDRDSSSNSSYERNNPFVISPDSSFYKKSIHLPGFDTPDVRGGPSTSGMFEDLEERDQTDGNTSQYSYDRDKPFAPDCSFYKKCIALPVFSTPYVHDGAHSRGASQDTEEHYASPSTYKRTNSSTVIPDSSLGKKSFALPRFSSPNAPKGPRTSGTSETNSEEHYATLPTHKGSNSSTITPPSPFQKKCFALPRSSSAKETTGARASDTSPQDSTGEYASPFTHERSKPFTITPDSSFYKKSIELPCSNTLPFPKRPSTGDVHDLDNCNSSDSLTFDVPGPFSRADSGIDNSDYEDIDAFCRVMANQRHTQTLPTALDPERLRRHTAQIIIEVYK